MAYDAWEDAYLHQPGTLERLEKTFQCCGYSSLMDRPVPDDCAVSRNFGYTEPCRAKLVDAGVSVLRGIGISLMVIAGIEVLIFEDCGYPIFIYFDRF
jgi:hypothetical protein